MPSDDKDYVNGTDSNPTVDIAGRDTNDYEHTQERIEDSTTSVFDAKNDIVE